MRRLRSSVGYSVDTETIRSRLTPVNPRTGCDHRTPALLGVIEARPVGTRDAISISRYEVYNRSEDSQ